MTDRADLMFDRLTDKLVEDDTLYVLLEILRIHRPKGGFRDDKPMCGGCWTGGDDEPEWPCETAALIVDYMGVNQTPAAPAVLKPTGGPA